MIHVQLYDKIAIILQVFIAIENNLVKVDYLIWDLYYQVLLILQLHNCQ